MVLERLRENYYELRSNVHRAIVRPDPYGLPGWIINSDQLADALIDTFSGSFRKMIDMASEYGTEVGSFICYDAYNDTMKLGPLCLGAEQMVVIRDCIGYRPIGSFHVHLGEFRNVLFSPPDISGGLHEFALAVGGNIPVYEMAVLSPFNYWKLTKSDKDGVDFHLYNATEQLLLANMIYRQQVADWAFKVRELQKQADQHMSEVYELLGLSYVRL